MANGDQPPWLAYQKPEENVDEPWTDFQTEDQAVVQKQKTRATFQGFTLGLADEIEAMARSMVSSRSYEEIRDEIRAKINDYRKAHPGEALSMELLGALAPTALAFLSPIPGDEAAVSAHLLGVSTKVLKRGAVEGSVAGYGTGEKGVIEDLTRVPIGATVGVVFTGLTTLALKPAGVFLNSVMTRAREKLGDKGAGQVADELRRLAEATGKTEDQILKDIVNGEIIADNPTLKHILSVMNAELSPGGSQIDEVLMARAKIKKTDASEAMQDVLVPGSADDNVFQIYIRSAKKAQQRVEELYSKVWEKNDKINDTIFGDVSIALKKLPNAIEALDEIYLGKGLPPLVRIIKKGKNKGELEFTRRPTLEDAEIVRRALSEAKSSAYSSGKGTLGGILDGVETQLRKSLDDFSDPLRIAREEASIVFKARDAFEMGRKALNQNTDELAVALQDMMTSGVERGNAEALKAFRAGIMNALRNKIRKSPTFFNKASKEGEHFNELLRMVFPEESIDDILKRVNLAATTQNTKTSVLGGSPTAHREAAQVDIGMVTGAFTGNMNALGKIAERIITDLKPKLSAKQRNKLVNYLLSEDPELVRKALLDQSWMAKLQGIIERGTIGLFSGTQRFMRLEGANVAGDESDKAINTLTQ